jgi:DhnA family fructose-bisphosphate aldolase class Ia
VTPEPADRLRGPVLILAADHRAPGVMTIEGYGPYVAALTAALPACDGILASRQPLADLVAAGAVRPGQRTYLSINRTGLAGSAFELDDRLVTSVGRAAADGWTGIKHMTRIDLTDPMTAPALELLGQVIDDARAAGMEALIEALSWRAGAMARDTDSVVAAAVIAHDMGAPVLKVPVPEAAPGRDRIAAVARVVGSVGVPVLFLGGPRGDAGRQAVLDEVTDAMAGGAAGMAIGRQVFGDPEPEKMARLVADAVHGG